MRWPIMRAWTVLHKSARPQALNTSDLERFRSCALLGSAGLGKTEELKFLAELERQHGRDVLYERLAMLSTNADHLESRLDAIASAATANSAIYLDALDEAMIPVRTAGLILATWIRTRLRE